MPRLCQQTGNSVPRLYLQNHCQTNIPNTLLSSCVSLYKFLGKLGCYYRRFWMSVASVRTQIQTSVSKKGYLLLQGATSCWHNYEGQRGRWNSRRPGMAAVRSSHYVLRSVCFFIPNSLQVSAKLDPGFLIFEGERDVDTLLFRCRYLT